MFAFRHESLVSKMEVNKLLASLNIFKGLPQLQPVSEIIVATSFMTTAQTCVAFYDVQVTGKFKFVCLSNSCTGKYSVY